MSEVMSYVGKAPIQRGHEAKSTQTCQNAVSPCNIILSNQLSSHFLYYAPITIKI